LKDKTATYLNISPASHVQPIIKAQGFTRYSSGQFVTFPTLSRMPNDNPRTVLGTDVNRPGAAFEPFERELLLRHSEYGCISLWCRTVNRAYPFVFLPRVVKSCIPCVQLIYCREFEDFVRFSGMIGPFLLLRGRPLVIIDSTGPVLGLFGRSFDGAAPKYFRGSEPPSLGDLAYTEAPMFGLTMDAANEVALTGTKSTSRGIERTALRQRPSSALGSKTRHVGRHETSGQVFQQRDRYRSKGIPFFRDDRRPGGQHPDRRPLPGRYHQYRRPNVHPEENELWGVRFACARSRCNAHRRLAFVNLIVPPH
jgi:hypothetical protein